MHKTWTIHQNDVKGYQMDKLIKAQKKKMDKGMNTLIKKDKKMDAKIGKCDKKMKKK